MHPRRPRRAAGRVHAHQAERAGVQRVGASLARGLQQRHRRAGARGGVQPRVLQRVVHQPERAAEPQPQPLHVAQHDHLRVRERRRVRARERAHPPSTPATAPRRRQAAPARAPSARIPPAAPARPAATANPDGGGAAGDAWWIGDRRGGRMARCSVGWSPPSRAVADRVATDGVKGTTVAGRGGFPIGRLPGRRATPFWAHRAAATTRGPASGLPMRRSRSAKEWASLRDATGCPKK